MGFNNGWLKVFCGCLMVGFMIFYVSTSQAQQKQTDNKQVLESMSDLKKQIQALQDVEEVKQVHLRYVNYLTLCQWDDMISLFAQDATLDVSDNMAPVKGKDAIGNFYKNVIAKSGRHVGKEAVMTIHPLVSVSGDTAKGNWMLYIITAPDQESQKLKLTQAIYDLEYKKENGLWKISFMKMRTRLTLGPQN
jgi:ketosteroid isomerase-like protein